MHDLFSSELDPYFSHLNGKTIIFEGTAKVLYITIRILKFLVMIPNIALIVNHGLDHSTGLFKFHKANEENAKLIFIKSSQNYDRLSYILLTFFSIKDL